MKTKLLSRQHGGKVGLHLRRNVVKPAVWLQHPGGAGAGREQDLFRED